MEKKFKSILSVLLIASTVFLVSSVALFFMRQAEIEKRVVLEKQLDELNKEKTKLTRDLDEAIAIKNDLEVKLSSLEEKAKSLEGQLADEKRSRELVSSQLEDEKRGSKKLVDDLMKIRDEKERAALDLANAKSECNILKVQLSSIQQAKEILEGKLKELLAKNEVELERIVVKPEVLATPQKVEASSVEVGQTAPSSNEIKGEVLVVNKKFDFAVVSLGEESGITPGMNLGVYRNGQFLTMLVVEKVQANMSAAKIPPASRNIDIKEGDTVVVVR